MSPGLMAAFFNDGSYPREFLEAGRVRIERAVLAKGHQEPWFEGSARAGQVPEQIGLLMALEQGVDLFFQERDVFKEHAQLSHQRLQMQEGGLQHRLIGGQDLSWLDQGQALGNQLGGTDRMPIVEGFERGRWPRYSKRCCCHPCAWPPRPPPSDRLSRG